MKLNNLIDDLRGRVLACEMELNLIEQDLQEVEIDLCHLNRLHEDLIYNLNLLGSKKVIVAIRSYQQSMQDLKIVKKKIIKFKNMQIKLRDKLEKKIKEYEDHFNQFEKQYGIINDEVRTNILVFKPKKRETNDGK